MNALQLFMICLAGWVNRNQQDVIEYLQEEVRVLREQLGKKPNFNDDKRRRLAAKAKKIRRRHLKGIATLATPRTLLDWQQRLIARKYNGNSSAQRVDLPPRGKCASFILTKDGRREPYLGAYTRIQGALQNLGHEIGPGTIAKVLKAGSSEADDVEGIPAHPLGAAGEPPSPPTNIQKQAWKSYCNGLFELSIAA